MSWTVQTVRFFFAAELVSDQGAGEFLKSVRLSRANSSRVKLGMNCVPLDGVWDCTRGKWLDEQIVEFERDVRWSNEGRLIVPTGFEDAAQAFSFDPEYGFLPNSQDPVPDKKTEGFNWTCREWRELSPDWWFPWSGKWGNLSGDPLSDWEVQSVELNQPVAAHLFQPPRPMKGTRIYGLDGVVKVHGVANSLP
ncbi:hypothetical protein GC163_14195 [bacterium]|nr:hypothetical protein [bacterium]